MNRILTLKSVDYPEINPRSGRSVVTGRRAASASPQDTLPRSIICRRFSVVSRILDSLRCIFHAGRFGSSTYDKFARRSSSSTRRTGPSDDSRAATLHLDRGPSLTTCRSAHHDNHHEYIKTGLVYPSLSLSATTPPRSARFGRTSARYHCAMSYAET